MNDKAKKNLLLIFALTTCFPAVASAAWTPLDKASADGRMSEVKALIAAGANVNEKNKHGLTPLHYATSHARADVVKLLLAAGANVNAKDKSGLTPLHYASESDYASEADRAAVVRLLKAAGGKE